jgi:hypothetical protein
MGWCLLDSNVELPVGGRGRHQSVTTKLLVKSKSDFSSLLPSPNIFKEKYKSFVVVVIDWVLNED